ncbi:MAG: P-II family nitrogen regulator [Leptospirales bacterium]
MNLEEIISLKFGSDDAHEKSDSRDLCEIMAIIRPDHRESTQKALEEAGIPSYSTFGVLGRGKQKGLRFKGEETSESAISFLPRQLFMLVVERNRIQEAVSIIKKSNQSAKGGRFGDGKIFVLKTEFAVRISSGETGGDAL